MPHEKGRPVPTGGPESHGPGKVVTPENRPESHSLTSGHSHASPEPVTDITTVQPVDWDDAFGDVKPSSFPSTCLCAWHECETEIPWAKSYCGIHECTVNDCTRYGAYNGICDEHERLRRFALKAVQKDRAKRPGNGIKSQDEENEIAYRREKARLIARDRIAEETGASVDWSERAHDGASWLTTEDAEDAALWGSPELPLWMPGESLQIVGPPSVGKSTLAHVLVWGSLGLVSDALGFPVLPVEDGGVLYLAMDRPKQIRRAMARFVKSLPNDERDEALNAIRERLTVWEGPLPGDICADKRLLVNMAEKYGRTRIVVDSVKDLLPNPSDDARGGQYNTARQEALASGLEWVELHHNRKANGENREPNALDDVYGSRWITAGAGSVFSLFGQPGDIVLSLRHLKPLGEPLLPKSVLIDRQTGGVSLYEDTTPEDIVIQAGPDGLNVNEIASVVFGTSKLTKSQIETTRRKLNREVNRKLEKYEGPDNITRYRAIGSGLTTLGE